MKPNKNSRLDSSPERSAMTPERSAMTPERSAMTPERPAMTPERPAMTPEPFGKRVVGGYRGGRSGEIYTRLPHIIKIWSSHV
ncbi:MAG: hypothetical protein GDA42_00785 [Ekhidna sp.]|nr:hypothetical protein [Ekhidna sp.]